MDDAADQLYAVLDIEGTHVRVLEYTTDRERAERVAANISGRVALVGTLLEAPGA